MADETLFIPIGYGSGTIVYDKNKNPYLVGKSIGGSLHQIKEISQEEAKTHLDRGAKVDYQNTLFSLQRIIFFLHKNEKTKCTSNKYFSQREQFD